MKAFLELFKDLPAPGVFTPDQVLRDLGEGLVLRRAGPADVEPLAAFSEVAQADAPAFEPISFLAQWTRELLGGDHPRMRVEDAMLVEDTRRARIASTLLLTGHHFRYAGVPIDAGQPELISTHPDYRNRGLVRSQFEYAHRWSAERGDAMLFIEGIPYYYRQFGYELAIPHQAGRTALRPDLPSAIPTGLAVRDARASDIPFLDALYAARADREILFCERAAQDWHFEFHHRERTSYRYRVWRVVEDAGGTALGAFSTLPVLIEGELWANVFEIASGAPAPEVFAAGLCDIARTGEALRSDDAPFERVRLALGRDHPVYDIDAAPLTGVANGQPLYARVPDLAHFLRLISPALERRLADSPLAGFTGALRLSFYTSGVVVRFESGRLVEVEEWRPDTENVGDAAFPDRSFLQLLFGRRSRTEIEYVLADARHYSDAAAALVDALFPTGSTALWFTG